MTVLRPNWTHLSLPELETKIRFLWEEHHLLDEESITLRKREEQIEQRMQEIVSEAAAIKFHMKSLHPVNVQDVKTVLQLIKEEAQHLSILEGTDEEIITSIIAMVESIQAVYRA